MFFPGLQDDVVSLYLGSDIYTVVWLLGVIQTPTSFILHFRIAVSCHKDLCGDAGSEVVPPFSCKGRHEFLGTSRRKKHYQW